MSSFCPLCGNGLQIKEESQLRYICRTCPYTCSIVRDQVFPLNLKKKQVDDVLGGAEAWENVDKTQVHCPKCGNGEAFFMQIQTRSADEPMTTFYKCTNLRTCGARWKEG